MRERNKKTTAECITVDIGELQQILCVGRNTASKIGKDSGARIKVGDKRVLYLYDRVKEYMYSLAEEGSDDLSIK